MGILLSHHIEHLRTSGLSDETIASARLRSITEVAEAGQLLNWTGPGPAPAIALPNLGADGEPNFTYLRPDLPRQKGFTKKGEPRLLKYETPLGQAPRPYFAPGTAALLADPKQPLVFTEGIKKALAVRQVGLAAVSAPGVSCWHDVEMRRSSGEWRLHPEIAALPLRGRRCEVVFDGGDTTRNHDVMLAEARLARMLLDAGAAVRLARVPFADGKVGVDDWLVGRPDPARDLRALLSEGIQADPLKRDLKSLDKTEVWQLVNEDQAFLASLYVAPDILFALISSELRGKLPRETLRRVTRDFGAKTEPVDDEPVVSAEDEAAADRMLREPDLLKRLLDAIGRSGLVGERQAATFVLLAAISRHLPQPINLILKAPSSSGKNWLCKRVLSFFPAEDVQWVSGLSEQALRYLDEPGALKHKVLVLDEMEGGERATYDLRQLTEGEGKITLWVPERSAGGVIRTVPRTVEGPICLITTTTRYTIHDENETRTIEVALNASQEQNEAVVDEVFLSEIETRPDASEEQRAWCAALAMLEPKPVKIDPKFTVPLRNSVDTRKTRSRRDARKVASLVKAVATLHQRQRGVDELGRVVVTDEDVEAVLALARAFRSALPPALSRAADILRKKFGSGQFTSAGVDEALGVSKTQRKRTMSALVEEGVLNLVKDGGPGRSAVYQFVSEVGPSADGPRRTEWSDGGGGAGVGPPRSNGGRSEDSPRGDGVSGDSDRSDQGEGEEGDQPDLWDLPKGGQ